MPVKYRCDTEDMINGEGGGLRQHRTVGREFMGESGCVCVCLQQCVLVCSCVSSQVCLSICEYAWDESVVVCEFIGLCLSVQVSIRVYLCVRSAMRVHKAAFV